MQLPELYQQVPMGTAQIEGLFEEYDAIVAELLDIMHRAELSPARAWFEITGYGTAMASLNSAYWQKAMDQMKLMQYMSSSARSDWSNQIHSKTCQPFKRSIVFATFLGIYEQRAMLLANCADDIFRALSGAHVTNTPQGFRERMILNNTFDEWGSTTYRKVDVVDDLRRLIVWIQNPGEEPSCRSCDTELSKARKSHTGEWYELDGGALRVRAYKIGTLHVEVAPEIATGLNKLLAVKYPFSLADVGTRGKRATPKAAKPIQLIEDAVPAVVLEALLAMPQPNSRFINLSPSWDKNLRQRIVALCKLAGATITGDSAAFPYSAKVWLDYLTTHKTCPDFKSHQYYPTPGTLADKVREAADLKHEHRILEPSCGTGALLNRMPYNASITGIEISPMFAAIAKAVNPRTHIIHGDFLELAAQLPQFDRIVMNPPFSEGRARVHIEAAVALLAPGGKLVAVVPEGFRVSDEHAASLSVPFFNEFEGTGVAVRILTIERRTIAAAAEPARVQLEGLAEAA